MKEKPHFPGVWQVVQGRRSSVLSPCGDLEAVILLFSGSRRVLGRNSLRPAAPLVDACVCRGAVTLYTCSPVHRHGLLLLLFYWLDPHRGGGQSDCRNLFCRSQLASDPLSGLADPVGQSCQRSHL